MEVSTADLARILGITDRRVQQLENVGVLQRVAHGEWPLPESVQAYVRHRLQSETRKRRQTKGNAEEKLKSAKASREELKLALEERAVVPTDEAIAALDEIVGTLRADLAGVPARLTRDMGLRERIENEIDAVLDRCADSFERRAREFRPDLRPGGDADPADPPDDA